MVGTLAPPEFVTLCRCGGLRNNHDGKGQGNAALPDSDALQTNSRLTEISVATYGLLA